MPLLPLDFGSIQNVQPNSVNGQSISCEILLFAVMCLIMNGFKTVLFSIFWLSPVALAYNLGFPARELRKLETLTSKHQKELLEAWNDYFGI